MRKVMITCLIAFTIISGFTQPYKFFNEDFTVFTANSFIFPYNTLSVASENSALNYSFQTMVNHSGETCFDINGPGFLGSHAMWDTVKHKYLLFNRFDDSIRIMTHKTTGEKWIAWVQNGDTARAEVTAVDTHLIGDNIIDTIKTIEFIYPENNSGYNETIHNHTFTISRERGLLQCFNIVLFPGLPSMQVLPQTYELYINPEIPHSAMAPAITDSLADADLYNLQVGDELHTHRGYWTGEEPDYVFNEFKYIGRVIDRTDAAQYITLEFRRKFKKWTGDSVSSQYIDTVSNTYNKTPLDVMPPYRHENPEEDFAEISGLTIKHGRVSIFRTFCQLEKTEDDCWELTPFKPRNYDYTPQFGITGLGKWYYDGGDAVFDNYHKLVYYKLNNGEEWGTPLDFEVGLQHIAEESVSVYPNPVDNILMIKGSNKLNREIQFQIFDLQGRKQLHKTFSKFPLKVNTGQLSTGILFYRLGTRIKVIKTGKIIKTEQ